MMRLHFANPVCGSACLAFLLLTLSPFTMVQSPSDYESAVAAFNAGDYSAAEILFAKTEAASPGSTDALLYEAKCMIQLQQFVDADKTLRDYLAHHPESPEALYLLGFVLHRENKPAESLAIYTKAAVRKPPGGDDLKIVGLDYVLLNDYADAIKWLEKAVEMEPRNEEAWYFLGRAYYTKSRLPEAKKAFRTVLDLNPRHAKAENSLGLIFEAEAQPSEALQSYRNAIEWQAQSNHPSEQPYLNLGSLLMEQNRTEEAVASLERAVQLAPGNGLCHLKLGTALLRLAKLKEAQRELEEATRLEPENPAAHYQLGRLYKQVKAMDRAKAEFDRAGEIHSREASTKPRSPQP